MTQPSLRGLRAFAETVRAGSIASAAGRLNVSPSAVSHLLRGLEHDLGVPLFAERGRLTEGGERLGQRLCQGFDTIEAAIRDATHRAGDVRVSALSSFLTLWLVPLLPSFQARHPAVQLLLSTGLRAVDLTAEPFDCAIRWGTGGWTGLEATLLFRDEPVVVVNPRLMDDPQSLPRLAGRTRPDDWPLVASALGWPDRPPSVTFETRALAVQAAVAGIGAAVVDRNLVTGLLASGLIEAVAPDPPVRVPQGHWFVALPEKLRARPVRQFRDWLVSSAEHAP